MERLKDVNFDLNCRFDGMYKNGKKNGYGIMKFPNGSQYAGYFKDGKLNGRFVFTNVNREVFIYLLFKGFCE
jgi:hypothetical protein